MERRVSRRSRQLGEEEKALWALVVRDVAPLRVIMPSSLPPVEVTAPVAGAVPPAGSPVRFARHFSPAIPPPSLPTEPAVRLLLATKLADSIGQRQPGMDDYSWRRFSQGGMRVDSRLDLHGMVAQDAFRRLMEFMDVAWRRGARCVEIITGLGSGEEGGILRRELPVWLERPEIRHRILGTTYPHAGNRGSVRVLLKRRKSK